MKKTPNRDQGADRLRTPEALVKPALLQWGRVTMGLTLEGAATKISQPPDRLAAWEAGDSRPSVAQLAALAQVYKRPLAAFFLPNPPTEEPFPHDFRRGCTEAARSPSPALILELRRARERRSVALDLLESMGESYAAPALTINRGEPYEEAAAKVRDWLGVTMGEQAKWRDARHAFRAWRERVEDRGILVFQASGIPVREIRGFSMGDNRLPVIGVNSKDRVRGRIFTLLHELTHLLTDSEGLCDLLAPWGIRFESHPSAEAFCNYVAGAILVPRASLLADPFVKARIGTDSAWSDSELQLLVRKFHASPEVVARRLTLCGVTSPGFYTKRRRFFEQLYESLEELPETRDLRIPQHQRVLNSAGKAYARVVLGAYYRDTITSSELARYLGINLKNLPRLEKAVL